MILKLSFFLGLLCFASSVLSQGEYLWSTAITSNSNSTEFGDLDLIVDDEGYSYVTASYKGSLLDTTGVISTSYFDYDVFVAKIDPLGNLVWVRQLTGPADDLTYAITLDENNNCYITGSFSDSLNLDGNFLASAASSYEQFYVLKLDTNGNLVWYFTTNYTTNVSKALDIEVDHLENCYVVGSFKGNLQLGDNTLLNSGPNFYKESGLIFKLNSSGSVQWYKQLQGSHQSDDETGTDVTEISKAGYNEYYIGANFRSYCIFSDTTFYPISNDNQYQDALIAKIDTQGNFIWRYNYGIINESSNDISTEITALETNSNGELCVAGTFGGGTDNGMNLLIGTFTASNGWYEDIYYAKFDSNGNFIWAQNVYGGNNPDSPNDMALAPSGEYLISATMSQNNGFSDTTIENLNLYHKGTFSVSGIDGSFIHYENSYPSSVALEGFAPRYCFDSYGNRYTFGNSTSYPGQGRAFFINKKSSGDISLSGTVFKDINLDSIIDINEDFLANIIIVGDSGMFYKTTDSLGRYEVQLDTNNHVLKVVLPPYWYVNYPASPNNHNTFAPYPNDSVTNLNFGLAMIPGITDVRSVLTSSRPVPGFEHKMRIEYKNVGTDTSFFGSIMLVHDDTLSFVSASESYSSYIGDTLIWLYDSLSIGEERQIDVFFNVPADVNLLGETLTSYVDITPSITDTNMVDNSDTLHRIVVGAYDPNYKANEPKGLFTPGYITILDSIFEYEIHFQNTGTDSAVNIVLVDTLTNSLDVSSFEMLSASHNYTYQINGPGIVTWTFANIMLPDSSTNLLGSQGFVRFRIKTDGVKPPGTTIENKAYIYFDFNPPIITNTVLNTIYDCEDIPLIVSSSSLCQGETLVVYSQEGSMNDYAWFINNTPYSTIDTLIWFADSSYTFDLKLTTSNDLCSKDTIISISVNPIFIINENDEYICQGDSIFIYGDYRNAAGVYFDSLLTFNGCDSILKTILYVNQNFVIAESSHTICQGDSAFIYGEYRDSAGFYFDSLQTFNGCDSILSTILYVNQNFLILDSTFTICQGDSVFIYGEYRNAPGIYYDTLVTVSGCDSIVFSVLSVSSCAEIGIQTLEKFKIYPNPGSGIFTIDFNYLSNKKVELKVYDVNFKLVKEEIIPENHLLWYLDLRSIENGIYFLEIDFEGDNLIKKLIKL